MLLQQGIRLLLTYLVIIGPHSVRANEIFGMRPLNTSVPTGGAGGIEFSDLLRGSPNDTNKAVINGVHAMTFTYSGQLESIQVTYRLSNGSLYNAPRRGANQTSKSATITFSHDEYIEKIVHGEEQWVHCGAAVCRHCEKE